MKVFIQLSPLCFIWLFATGCVSTASNPDQMIAAAKEIDAKVSIAFNKGDLDGMMENYWHSPELIVYPPDTLQVKGWDAVKEDLKILLAQPVKFELIDPHYVVAGDYVFNYGQWKMTQPGPHKAPLETVGRYTTLLAKKDGKWVIIIDHPSIPLPPEAPATAPSGAPAK